MNSITNDDNNNNNDDDDNDDNDNNDNDTGSLARILALPMRITPNLALVRATLRRRGSDKKPIP